MRTQNDLALRYNDQSVLENHHASTGLTILQKIDGCNFLSHLDHDRYAMWSRVMVEFIIRSLSFRSFRQLVISTVIATDMSRHLKLQEDFAELFLGDEQLGPTGTFILSHQA